MTKRESGQLCKRVLAACREYVAQNQANRRRWAVALDHGGCHTTLGSLCITEMKTLTKGEMDEADNARRWSGRWRS
jgi:hypothetical protein